ncbi:hypothetical protein LCGC14_1978890, partial [marine sediment metagenome]
MKLSKKVYQKYLLNLPVHQKKIKKKKELFYF